MIDLKISEIQPTTDNSLDVDDEHDQEVRVSLLICGILSAIFIKFQLVTQTQRPLIEKDDSVTEPTTQRVKILKFINESEDDGQDSDNAREREDDEYEKERRKLRKRRKHKSRHGLERVESTTPILSTTSTAFVVLERSSDQEAAKTPHHDLSDRKRVPEFDELEGEEELKRFEATSTTERWVVFESKCCLRTRIFCTGCKF